MHFLLLLYKSVANRLSNAHNNPVTTKYDIQPPTVQATQPCKVHSAEYILHMLCLLVSYQNQTVHTQSLLTEKLY